tara:strand:+ start:110 stop:283 length:174 start_codon:yes stop_codon:yes gene_type:complete
MKDPELGLHKHLDEMRRAAVLTRVHNILQEMKLRLVKDKYESYMKSLNSSVTPNNPS